MLKQEQVVGILSEFNKSLGEGSKAAVDIDQVMDNLLDMGAGVDLVAKELSFEDIAACGVPKSIARAIAKLWRGEDQPKSVAAQSAVAAVSGFGGGNIGDLALAFGNVSALNDRVLLSNYHPTDRDDIVAELTKRSKGRKFLVFVDKATMVIDLEASLANLQMVKQGVDVGETIIREDGTMARLYASGEVPDAVLSICPVHRTHIVGPNGFCPKCSRNWGLMSTELYELAYLQAKEVWGKIPEATDPRMQMLFMAVKNGPDDQYWSEAKMFREEYRSSGQVISNVAPVGKTK